MGARRDQGAICCWRGEGVNHLPEKTLASCPNFYETVEEEQGSYDELT